MSVDSIRGASMEAEAHWLSWKAEELRKKANDLIKKADELDAEAQEIINRMTVSELLEAKPEEINGKSSCVYFRCYNFFAPLDTISWFRFEIHPHSSSTTNLSSSSSSSSSVTVDPIWTGTQSQFSAVVGLGSRIYCLGGRVNECPGHDTNLVTVFDPLNPDKGWVHIAPMLLPRADSDFKAVASDGKIFAFDGLEVRHDRENLTLSDIREKLVEVYDPSTGAWSFLEPLSLVVSGASGDQDGKKKYLFDFLNPQTFEIYDISVYVADEHRLLLSCASWPSGARHQQIITEYIFDTRSHSLHRPGDVAFHVPFGGDAFMVNFSGFLMEAFNFKKSCWQTCDEPYISQHDVPPRPGFSNKHGAIVHLDDISSHAFRGEVHLLTDLCGFSNDPSRNTLRYQKFDLRESVDAHGNETMEATTVSQIDVDIPSDQGILCALLL